MIGLGKNLDMIVMMNHLLQQKFAACKTSAFTEVSLQADKYINFCFLEYLGWVKEVWLSCSPE